MRSIDPLLYKVRDGKNYTCRHFLYEAWKYLTGEDLLERIPNLFNEKEPLLTYNEGREFCQLKQPQTPSIVLMQASKHAPHVGIYIDGCVMHLGEAVELQPFEIVTRHFEHVRFYI